jgi:uncharacterized protein YkwD
VPSTWNRVRSLLGALQMFRFLSAAALAVALCLPCVARAEDMGHIRAYALELVNQSRKEANLPPLVPDEKLNRMAQAYAQDMLKRNFFAHVSPDGGTPGDRFKKVGGSRWVLVTENIFMVTETRPPITDAILKHVQEGWMNSPGHRANILHPGLTHFGYGIVTDDKGELYAVQNFSGPGPADAGAGEAKIISPAEQVALMLDAVNTERKNAGRRPLAANDSLTQGASGMMPAPESHAIAFPKRNLLDAVPAVDRQSWSRIAVTGWMCGGCGAKAVQTDIASFLAPWMKDKQSRAHLLSTKMTHMGFVIGADGSGKKVAIGLIGERKTR